MEPNIVFAVIALIVAVSLYISPKDEKRELAIIEKAQTIELPKISSEQQLNVYWWRKVYQQQLGYSGDYYQPSLSLSLGYRHVVVPYVEGYVKGFNKRTGVWEWTLEVGERVSAGVVSDRGALFVGGEDGKVVAVDPLSGKERWSKSLQGQILSLSVGKKHLYVYTFSGRLFALNKRTGEVNWKYLGKEPQSSIYGASAAIEDNDVVYFGNGYGFLIALNISNGVIRYQRVLGQPRGFSDIEAIVDLDSNLIIDKDYLVAGTFGGKLYALNKLSRLTLWEKDLSLLAPLHLDNIQGEKIVVVQDDSDFIYAYRLADGTVVWKNQDLRYRGLSHLQAYKDYWLATDNKGTTFVLNRNDGKLLYYYQGDISLAMNAIIDKDTIYQLSQEGKLFSMKFENKNTSFVPRVGY